jgi:LysM repeat protein
LQSSIVNVQSGAVNGTTTSTLSYDANAHLSYASTTGAAAKSISYTTDAAGQVMVRTQSTSGSANSPRQFYFYVNGLRVGEVGNNGTDNVDYSSAIAANGSVAGPGPFRGGSTTGASYADFDENYAAINTSSAAEAGAGATYTVRQGDTLQSIAQSLWGDAGLWYMLAEANGLTGSTSLSAGQSLTIPARVSNLHNTAQTFKPYDAGKAIGDVQPGAPVPPPAKKGGCGIFGQILAYIVASLVVAVTGNIPIVSAVLADAARQGVLIATGDQEKFSWKSVAIAGIADGVGRLIPVKIIPGGSALLNEVLHGVISGAVT